MKGAPTTIHEIDLYQLTLLLQDLESLKKNISIRVQVQDEPWMETFSTVLVFSRHALILSHIQAGTVKYIRQVSDIIGFEIDQPYMIFNPFQPYRISPGSEDVKLTNGLRYG